MSHQWGTLLVVGDSNVGLNPALDKYPSNAQLPHLMLKSFHVPYKVMMW